MASAQGTKILQDDGSVTLTEDGSELLSEGDSDCDCCGPDSTNTEPCDCCPFYRLALWSSAIPLFDYDGDGDLDPSSGAIWTDGYTDFSCDVTREDGVTRLIYKDPSDHKWYLDPRSDGSLLIRSIAADLPCPPIGPGSPPADGTDEPGVWEIANNTTGVTTWQIFGFECCNAAVNCAGASDDLFIDGLIGHLKLDAGTFPDDSGQPTWDGHVHRYPVAGVNVCNWAARWVGPAMDGSYSAGQVRVGMKGGGYAALTPVFGIVGSPPFTAWGLWFVETGLPGGSPLVSWIKLCGSLPYAVKRYFPDSPDPSVLKIPPLISVTDGTP